jgi:hypothetical protein
MTRRRRRFGAWHTRSAGGRRYLGELPGGGKVYELTGPVVRRPLQVLGAGPWFVVTVPSGCGFRTLVVDGDGPREVPYLWSSDRSKARQNHASAVDGCKRAGRATQGDT